MNQVLRASAALAAPHALVLVSRRALIALFAFVALTLCWRAAEIRPQALVDPEGIAALLRFMRGLFPPDFSPEFLRVVFAAIVRTVAIAVAGTALSVLLAIPLAVLGTATLWHRGILLAGEQPGARLAVMAAVSQGARGLLGFLRAVPDLMWGLLFVVAVGLGSLPGTLALALSYCGMLGRVYADLFEDVDPRPLEALHSTGASRAQVFVRGIWPQAAPSVAAYTVYSFECCVRAASVLGFIGAGGIGYEINLSMRIFDYGQVLTLLLAFFGLATLTDAVSRYLRRRLHANAPAGTLAHERADARGSVRQWLSPWDRLGSGQLALLTAVTIVWSMFASGFFGGALGDAGLIARVVRFVGAMFPPDVRPEFLGSLAIPLLQTIGIAVIGTLLGIAFGAVLSLPATSTLVFVDENAAGRRSAIDRILALSTYGGSRLLLNVLRCIPELIWVMITVLAVGLGPFAGTLALGLHTAGVLGKLYAETFEEVPERPIEALRATGARTLQLLVWGIWPLARATLSSYTVLRWEMNLRASTILGLVGGGGLGQAIYENVQLTFYPRVLTLIAVVYLLVISSDWLSDRVRHRLGSG